MDIPSFRIRFPTFADELLWPTELIQARYDVTGCYINFGRLSGKCLEEAEMLLTAHLLQTMGSEFVPAMSHAGVVTNASVGGVTVGVSVRGAAGGPFAAWLSKTSFGEQLLALLRRQLQAGVYHGGSGRGAFRGRGGRF